VSIYKEGRRCVIFFSRFAQVEKNPQHVAASHPFQMPGVSSFYPRSDSCMRVLFVNVKVIIIISFSMLHAIFGLVCMLAAGRLVGALSLDVAGLLALVASTLRWGLGGAVAGEMADLTAVVAFWPWVQSPKSVSSRKEERQEEPTRHVAITTTGVAGLSTVLTIASTSTTIASLLTTVSAGLRTIASNMANLWALSYVVRMIL
jgi:hypothetical protein